MERNESHKLSQSSGWKGILAITNCQPILGGCSVLPASLYLQFHLPCLASASREDEAAVAPAGVTAAALAGSRHLGRLDCAASGSPFRGGWLLQTRTVA